MSITHGRSPRSHIWAFAADGNEVITVHVKVVGVPHRLLEIITIVNQDIMVPIVPLQSCTVVTLSGMVHSVRVKVVAAALLHGSLWI